MRHLQILSSLCSGRVRVLPMKMLLLLLAAAVFHHTQRYRKTKYRTGAVSFAPTTSATVLYLVTSADTYAVRAGPKWIAAHK